MTYDIATDHITGVRDKVIPTSTSTKPDPAQRMLCDPKPNPIQPLRPRPTQWLLVLFVLSARTEPFCLLLGKQTFELGENYSYLLRTGNTFSCCSPFQSNPPVACHQP